jgi:hypothetical protein
MGVSVITFSLPVIRMGVSVIGFALKGVFLRYCPREYNSAKKIIVSIIDEDTTNEYIITSPPTLYRN